MGMGINSGRNSGSALKVSFKRRLFGKNTEEVEDENEGPGSGRDYKRPSSDRSVRSFEGNGYVRYSLDAGMDVYISASNEDPFIDFDEPKGEKTGGRFLNGILSVPAAPARQSYKPAFGKIDEPNIVFNNALPEIKFSKSDFGEKVIVKEESGIMSFSTPAAQTAMTSSSVSVPDTNSPSTIGFESEYNVEVEHIGASGSGDRNENDIMETGVERLPSAPAHAERLPAARRVPKEEKTVAPEGSESVATAVEVPEVAEVPVALAPPISVMALPVSSSLLSVAPPAVMLMLSEPAQASEEEVKAALEGTEESALAAMAHLPSGLYAEGIEPIADAVAAEEEVISSSAGCTCQLAETSSAAAIRTIPILEYSDYAGYDFLPPVTEPVRREPRVFVPEARTISQMPEHIEIEDEVSGIMKLSVAGISNDEMEYSDAALIRESDIPDDGMEELCLIIDREREYLSHLVELADATELSIAREPKTAHVADIQMNEVEPMIEVAAKAANAVSGAIREMESPEAAGPNTSRTLTPEDETEINEMVRTLIETISAPEAEEAELINAEEVPWPEAPRPLVSFVFGSGGSESIHSFY